MTTREGVIGESYSSVLFAPVSVEQFAYLLLLRLVPRLIGWDTRRDRLQYLT